MKKNEVKYKEVFENKEDSLWVEEVSVDKLIEKYGSPLYVYSKKKIIDQFLKLKNNFKKTYSKSKIFYAVKANSNLTILSLLKAQGAYADCSCANELLFAQKAGFQGKECLFTSTNPNKEDLTVAHELGAELNFDNLASFQDYVALFGAPDRVCFRVNPGIGAGKFTQIVVGGEGTKFGMSPNNVLRAYQYAVKVGVKNFGIHMMTGSCILKPDYFNHITSRLLQIALDLKKELGISFDFFNIGGGLGIPYEPEENSLDIEGLAQSLSRLFKEKCQDYGFGEPELYLEPGRFIVAESGALLSQVNCIKHEDKIFAGLDAGMTQLIRPMLYGAYHHMILSGEKKYKLRAFKHQHIVGPICESTDCFAEDRHLPVLEKGDVIAIMDAGAYCYAMSSNFNGRFQVAEILIDGDKDYVIREKFTVEDFYAKQEIYEGL